MDIPRRLAYVGDLQRARGYINSQAAGRNVERLGPRFFNVPSERIVGAFYQVFLEAEGWKCTCADFASASRACKHIAEVLFRFFPDEAPAAPNVQVFQNSSKPYYDGARRFPHKPFPYREGPAESTRRDQAISSFDSRSEELLFQIADILNKEFQSSKVGRPTLPPGDKVFVMVARALHRKSMRRAERLLGDAAAAGKIAFAPSKGSLVAYNTSEETTKLLRRAYYLSVTPFDLMERDVIIDSTGLSPFFDSNWRHSNGGERNLQNGTRWFKWHLVIGRISKAILGFRLTEHEGAGSSDVSNLAPIVSDLAKRVFDVRYVIADNAYLSLENANYCADISAVLVGPLKPRNFRNGRPVEGVKRIVAFQKDDPVLYDELCRARQAIEGVFSVEKRTDHHIAAIGTAYERAQYAAGRRDSIFVSRQNEFLARLIRYNLMSTVTQEQLRNRLISYRKGSRFSHVREMIDAEENDSLHG